MPVAALTAPHTARTHAPRIQRGGQREGQRERERERERESEREREREREREAAEAITVKFIPVSAVQTSAGETAPPTRVEDLAPPLNQELQSNL